MRHTRIQVVYGAYFLHFAPFTGAKVRFWGALTDFFCVLHPKKKSCDEICLEKYLLAIGYSNRLNHSPKWFKYVKQYGFKSTFEASCILIFSLWLIEISCRPIDFGVWPIDIGVCPIDYVSMGQKGP